MSNANFILLDLEVNTEADRVSRPVSAHECRGAIIAVKVANEAGTAQYDPSVEVQDAEGNWVTIWQAATSITADGNYEYILYPGASGGDVDEVDAIPLPLGWRLKLAYTGTPSTDNADTSAHALCIV